MTYLALAPKSNASYVAYKAAAELVRERPPYPVPLHIRNAPTRMMKDLGYGKDYKYPHDYPDAFVADSYMPEELGEVRLYSPKDAGFEVELRKRLQRYLARRRDQRKTLCENLCRQLQRHNSARSSAGSV